MARYWILSPEAEKEVEQILEMFQTLRVSGLVLYRCGKI